MDVNFIINCLETNNIDLLDIDPLTMCRTCTSAGGSDFRGLFESTGVLKNEATGTIYRINEVVQTLTQSPIQENDGLPQMICRPCVKQFFTAFNFLALAKKIDAAFKKFVNTQNPQADVDDAPSSTWPDAGDDMEDGIEFEEFQEVLTNAPQTTVKPQEHKRNEDSVGKRESGGRSVADKGTKSTRVAKPEAGKRKIPSKVDGALPKPTSPPAKKAKESAGDKVAKVKNPDGQFQCPKCPNSYGFVQSLNRHLKTHNDDSGDAAGKQCPHCKKAFSRADALQRHIRTHTNERPYACEYCEKRFKQTSELKDHMLSHTKEVSFKCELCNKVLSTRMGFYYHNKLHKEEAMKAGATGMGKKAGQRKSKGGRDDDQTIIKSEQRT